jgi:heterotetrameric sarcosine oxidase delta subunit
MIRLPCPWCGPRDAAEFRYVGESRPRPDPATATVEEWRRHLYLRDNTAAPRAESWYHRMGCRQYLVVVRDPTTDEVVSAEAARGSADGERTDRGEGGAP